VHIRGRVSDAYRILAPDNIGSPGFSSGLFHSVT
jgi:hypothetical protein